MKSLVKWSLRHQVPIEYCKLNSTDLLEITNQFRLLTSVLYYNSGNYYENNYN